MRLPLLSYSCCALLFGVGLATARGGASEPPPVRVLLLPVTDATPEGGNMLAARSAVIRHRWQFEFLSRGFAVGSERLAAQEAQAGPAIPLTQAVPQSAEALDELARRTGVDWVVNVVVESASAEPGREADFEVSTRLHVQIRDATAHIWRHNGSYTGHAAGAGTPIMVFLRSLDTAARESIATVLASYPPQGALAGEDSLVDYLADATGLVTTGMLPAATQPSPDKAAP